MRSVLMNGKVLFSLLVLGFFVVMVTVALAYPAKARLMPLVIGIPGIAFSLLQLCLEIRAAMRVVAKPRDARSEFEKYQDEINRFAGDTKVSLDIIKEEPTMTVTEAPMDAAEEARRLKVMFSYFFATVAGVIVFGFWVTIPVFLVCFLRFVEKDSWKFALMVAGIATAGIYVLFELVMHMFLFRGLLYEAMLDRGWLGG